MAFQSLIFSSPTLAYFVYHINAYVSKGFDVTIRSAMMAADSLVDKTVPKLGSITQQIRYEVATFLLTLFFNSSETHTYGAIPNQTKIMFISAVFTNQYLVSEAG